MTYRQFINDIQTEIKQISADSYIPPRFVYYETINVVADFLKKDQDAKRKLQRLAEGWTELQGIDLEEVPTISCPDVDVRLCDRMMKSTKRLPATYTYSFGNIIKHVASPNFSYFFEPVTPRQWNAIQKRQYKDKNKYYYFFIDGFLYIPVPKKIDLPIQQVRMEAYFIDKHEVELFKKDSDCYDCRDVDACKSPMDYDVVAPFYLLNDVKKELLNRLTKIYVAITEDQYPNLNAGDKTNQRDLQNGAR